ncbi:ephrin type-A receptor 4-like protein, partial [Leptotrombidium deliense]
MDRSRGLLAKKEIEMFVYVYCNAIVGSFEQWVEESFTNFEQGINWRSYVVCDVAYKNVNNWLWTPFIERQDANRIYIEIKFSMRDCNLFPGMALSCKETFSLLYYEIDAQNKEPPPWEPESYKLIDRIAADEGRFTSNSEVIINTEVRSIPVTKKGVYFAFRDQGACLSLIAIKIYYIICPNVTMNFAYFPETPTGKELTAIVAAVGTCVANAVEIEKPRLLCKGDGNWTLPSGACKCMAGFEPVGNSCQVCPVSTFKPVSGDQLCGPCPQHSTAPYRGSTECRCDYGYYRAAKDPKWFACTQPPSAPLNLTYNLIDQSTVTLSWSSPKYLGGRNDTLYRVECEGCPSSVAYVPSQDAITETRVTISGLSSLSTFTFLVYAENGVSGHDPSQFVEISVTTESLGYISLVITEETGRQKYNVPTTNIPNIRVVAVKSTEIVLTWNSAEDNYLSDSHKYEVKYFQKGFDNNSLIVKCNKEEATLTNLKPKTEYGFQVRSKTNNLWSKPMFRTTGHLVGSTAYVGDDDSVQVRIIAGVSVAIVILVIVIIVMIVLYLRRSTDECNKKQPSDCDTLEYIRNGEVNSPTPLFPHCGPSRTYVDPHVYEDPYQLIFTKEKDASQITIEAIIGGGIKTHV